MGFLAWIGPALSILSFVAGLLKKKTPPPPAEPTAQAEAHTVGQDEAKLQSETQTHDEVQAAHAAEVVVAGKLAADPGGVLDDDPFNLDRKG